MKKSLFSLRFISIIQIFLLVCSTLALSFILGQTNVVSAQNEVPTYGPFPPEESSSFFEKYGASPRNPVQPASALQTGAGTQSASKSLRGVGLARGEAKDTVSVFDVAGDKKFVLEGERALKGYEKIVGKDGTTSYNGILENGDKFPDLEESTIKAFEESGGKFSLKGEYKTDILGFEFVGGWAHLIEGVVWAAAVVGVIQLFGGLFGAEQQLTNALSIAATAGILTYKGILAFTQQNFLGGPLKDTFVANYAPGIGIAVAVVVFVMLYKKEKKRVVELQCLPWEAPLGGSDCERCNQDPIRPCSEYRCKSLGQACDLVNKGTVEERCVWVSRNDVASPVITPWDEVLTKEHRYAPDNAVRPPNRGVKIQAISSKDGCVKPFTPLQFGVQLNEPGQCKIDIEIGNKSFDEMQFYFGESSFYRYNHTQQLRLPSPESIAAEGPEFPTEGIYNFYVRCRDANGNTNEDIFVFNFCVDKSPDTTPPLIEDTSIKSGSPVTFGAQNISLSVYVNEPAECKWSVQDKDYNVMENNMSCSTKVYEQNARQQYPCSTTLTGIKDKADNVYFFRCKDKPSSPESERNVNRESYRFVLKGSQTLNILNVGPSGTLTGSTDVISVNLSVKTDDGAEEGKSICYFSPIGEEGSFVAMFETNSFEHKQVLNLPSGSYDYKFRCVDAGGNAAESSTNFSVFVDRTAPQASRLYKEGPDALVLVTNEAAECSYSLNNCNFVFNEGLKMKLLDIEKRMIHAAEWKPNQALYIKCRDDYGNEPSPNSCTVVASATNII